MTAENLKNWLKEQMKLGDGQIAVGAIDGNQNRYIGVYDGKASRHPNESVSAAEKTQNTRTAHTSS